MHQCTPENLALANVGQGHHLSEFATRRCVDDQEVTNASRNLHAILLLGVLVFKGDQPSNELGVDVLHVDGSQDSSMFVASGGGAPKVSVSLTFGCRLTVP